jgi:hypothetical protein
MASRRFSTATTVQSDSLANWCSIVITAWRQQFQILKEIVPLFVAPGVATLVVGDVEDAIQKKTTNGFA